MPERFPPGVEHEGAKEFLNHRWDRLNNRFTDIVKVVKPLFHSMLVKEHGEKRAKEILGDTKERRAARKLLAIDAPYNFSKVAKIHEEFLKLKEEINKFTGNDITHVQIKLDHMEQYIEELEEQIENNGGE